MLDQPWLSRAFRSVPRHACRIHGANPAVEHVLGVMGLDFLTNSAASNRALVVVRLKAY